MAGRFGYVVAGALLLGAIAMVASGFAVMFRALVGIEEMPRLVGPGQMAVDLPEGRSTIFAERRSIVNDRSFDTGVVSFTCRVEGGKVSEAISNTMYTSDDAIEGHAAYDIEVPRAGTYTLACDADKPFVVAVGDDARPATFLIFGALVPFVLGGIIITLTVRKRGRR